MMSAMLHKLSVKRLVALCICGVVLCVIAYLVAVPRYRLEPDAIDAIICGRSVSGSQVFEIVVVKERGDIGSLVDSVNKAIEGHAVELPLRVGFPTSHFLVCVSGGKVVESVFVDGRRYVRGRWPGYRFSEGTAETVEALFEGGRHAPATASHVREAVQEVPPWLVEVCQRVREPIAGPDPGG